MSHIPIYLLLLYLLDSAVSYSMQCLSVQLCIIKCWDSQLLWFSIKGPSPPNLAFCSCVCVYLMFLHSLVTPVSSISGVLQGFRRARHQVIKYQLFSVCHGNPHASFLIGNHMDNRKPASSNRGEDREVFSVVPIRELSAKYLISKGFLNICTCLSRKSSVCRLQRTA